MGSTTIVVYLEGLKMDAAVLTPVMVKALKQHFAEQGE
jgi:hypothetical protein